MNIKFLCTLVNSKRYFINEDCKRIDVTYFDNTTTI